jgi:hypothetical protein
LKKNHEKAPKMLAFYYSSVVWVTGRCASIHSVFRSSSHLPNTERIIMRGFGITLGLISLFAVGCGGGESAPAVEEAAAPEAPAMEEAPAADEAADEAAEEGGDEAAEEGGDEAAATEEGGDEAAATEEVAAEEGGE